MIRVPPPFYRLPAVVAGRTDLSAAAKLLFALLAYLGDVPGEPFLVPAAKEDGRRIGGVPGLAARVGLPPRSVQRALADLRRAGLVKVKRTREGNAYRLLLPAACANLAHPDAPSWRKRSANLARQGRQPGASLPISDRDSTGKGNRPPSPSGAEAFDNGNGDGKTPDDLVTVYAHALGRCPTARQGEVLREAAARALRDGATLPLVASGILRAAASGDTAPQSGPRAAGEAAKEAVAAWARIVGGESRPNLAAVLADVAFVSRYRRGQEGPIEGEGLARADRVASWVREHGRLLAAATAWPGNGGMTGERQRAEAEGAALLGRPRPPAEPRGALATRAGGTAAAGAGLGGAPGVSGGGGDA